MPAHARPGFIRGSRDGRRRLVADASGAGLGGNAGVVWGEPGVPAAVIESVHATLASVALAMAIPARPSAEGQPSPLARLECQLLPPVSLVILPVFAFANAGVDLRGLAPAALAEPIPLGIALGLVLRKTAGVLGASLALVRTKVATLPDDCTWGMVLAMSMLCGIGFTVSLFIGNLAFGAGGEEAAQARLGVLTGAVVAGVMGCVAMLLANSMRGFARPAGERLSSGEAWALDERVRGDRSIRFVRECVEREQTLSAITDPCD